MKNWRQQLDRPVCMDWVFNFTDLFGLRTGSENRTLTDETVKITELKAQWVFQNDLYIHGFIIVIFYYDYTCFLSLKKKKKNQRECMHMIYTKIIQTSILKNLLKSSIIEL